MIKRVFSSILSEFDIEFHSVYVIKTRKYLKKNFCYIFQINITLCFNGISLLVYVTWAVRLN